MSRPRCSASSRRRVGAFASAVATHLSARRARRSSLGSDSFQRTASVKVSCSRRADCETRRSPFSTGCLASAGSTARRSAGSRSGTSIGCVFARRASTTVVAGLSGGNQQKIVLARWLAAQSKILILDEPTRGVDVGAKAEIHALIGELAEQGAAILLISSELPELLNLSDRILVLRAGRIVGELARAEASQERLLRLMAGLA